ncbi:lasso peptide biosynthesis PqqD family chaperone [Niameybacter massiliensis]|uniref:lasso peptide biosynthesis PqqD family chaperone n=1 Tax=Niameybacter massiliensis TaxID=1658108 RepID=UPI0006B4B596|nr:lasso peptide biosynthesis PqqD family chaperone [Niameybacter massiliensis]
MKETKEITLETMIRQTGDMDTSDIDGEKVMMDLDTGSYFMLNDVATHIWDLVEQPMKVAEVIQHLLNEYEIDEVTCKEQVMAFVNELCKRELVAIA